MASDFKGDPKEFAIVVPVPTVLEKGQIRVGERALIEHLDAYSAPRLVEYFDGDPCLLASRRELMAPSAGVMLSQDKMTERARGLGVTIEAQYTVGEYDILILSAKESAGLETEHEVLRGPGESERAGAPRLHVSAPAPDGLRVAAVHAADPTGHAERRWIAGAVCLRADPHGRVETTNYRTATAHRHGSSGSGGQLRSRPGGAVDVVMTRLHVRYDAASFPEDLVFQETADRANFQGRYVLRHP